MDDQSKHWFHTLDAREQAQVLHAVHYAEHHAGAGVPGHSQFMLIAKLAQLVDEPKAPPAKTQKVVYDSNAGVWRDVVTGVKAEL